MQDMAQIVFSGVCALVMAHDGTGTLVPKEMVFLKGTTTAQDIMPHHTYLVVSEDYEVKDVPSADGRVHEVAERYAELGKKYMYYELDSEEISVAGVNGPAT